MIGGMRDVGGGEAAGADVGDLVVVGARGRAGRGRAGVGSRRPGLGWDTRIFPRSDDMCVCVGMCGYE